MSKLLSRRKFLYGMGLGASALLVGLYGSLVQGAKGAITGGIQNRSNDYLQQARVTLFNDDLSFFREVRSNDQGEYSFGHLPSGSYKLGISAKGFAYEETKVEMRNSRQTLRFVLEQETEQGRWEVIGDTTPERFGGTNSGVLMPDGRIIFCHNTIDPVVFDPVSREKSFPKQSAEMSHSSNSMQGCHNVSHLLDGRVLYVGGGTLDNQGNFSAGQSAIRIVKAFDPKTARWEVFPPMNEVRWYPGLARLQDGDLLTFGGGQQPAKLRTATCEIFSQDTKEWKSTDSLTAEGGFGPTALLYTGEVFVSWYPPQLFNVETGRWRNTTNFRQPRRGTGEQAGQSVLGSGELPQLGDHPDHSIVVLPDGRVAAIGIWGAAMENGGSMVEIFDPASERWSLGANPQTIRAHPEVLQLPDGRIFVAAGAPQAGEKVFTNEWGYTNAVDLYDPLADSWRKMSPMKNAREYHAITLLLPDGRVLVHAGAGRPAFNPPPSVSEEIEAFSPPYLFRGPRPEIHSISATDLARGDSFSFELSFPAQLTDVKLIGVNAITHFLDAGIPRLLELPFSQSESKISAQIPTDSLKVMAGYYLLFAMTDDVPSIGRFVRVRAD
ncbi:DUF1929 domain-containing protein [Candidatus Acetothermia bacterium]|nr:DUF1929 domain-containing protein [Candidatus Acetothermia bacterium]MBI3643432.1 DUF1929 domain-containing protein [Candidatus Acetothermia bacterium]